MTGKNEIKLVDMIIIGKPALVRNAVRTAPDAICLTTEAGEILFFKFEDKGVKSDATEFECVMTDDSMKMQDEESSEKKRQKKASGFRPF